MAYESWSFKRKIQLDTTSSGANVAGNVSNFPVLIRLDSSNFNFSQADADGADIRFSDSDGTQLSYEIERWDSANQKAVIWVRVPQVDGNSNQDYIYMHWGKSGQITESNGPNTFESGNGYQAVWHLNEDPSGGLQENVVHMETRVAKRVELISRCLLEMQANSVLQVQDMEATYIYMVGKMA